MRGNMGIAVFSGTLLVIAGLKNWDFSVGVALFLFALSAVAPAACIVAHVYLQAKKREGGDRWTRHSS